MKLPSNITLRDRRMINHLQTASISPLTAVYFQHSFRALVAALTTCFPPSINTPHTDDTLAVRKTIKRNTISKKFIISILLITPIPFFSLVHINWMKQSVEFRTIFSLTSRRCHQFSRLYNIVLMMISGQIRWTVHRRCRRE